MNTQLDPVEARIIGSLMEKSMTTPEQYPLSLNALVSACNQKSSREPVMALDEATVQNALDGLARKYLVREKSGFGGRVAKYHHRLYNSEIGDFRFSDADAAVICLLLLRGPQTAGELRTRAARLHPFADVEAVEATLERLMNYPQGPFVAPLPREPGRREVRYAHLFFGDMPIEARATAELSTPAADSQPSTADRVAALELRVEVLESVIADLQRRIP